MAYIIIGATGDLGRALTREIAANGHDLVLVARDGEALDALAGGIAETAGLRPATVAADVTQGPGYLADVKAAAVAAGGVEGLLLPIGLSQRDTLATPADQVATLIAVNLTAVIEAVSGLWDELARAPGPVVVGFGSITGVRGRRRNLAYGAAKRALAGYFESLDTLGRDAGIAVQFYTLGFLATAKMAAEPTPLPKGDVARLAARVRRDLGRGSFSRWYPWWWRPAAIALRLVPAAVYRRIAALSG